MSASISQVQILLQNPLTSDLTRSVITAILNESTNPVVVADFILARLQQRVAVTAVSGDTICPCGCGRRLQPRAHDPRAFQAAALNAEAGDWLADLLLVPIGKRQNILRKRTWSHNFYSGTAQFNEEIRAGLASEWQSYDDLQYLVRERDGPFCALSGTGENIVCTEIFPTSQDRGRFDRFRILAHVFFDAEYDEYLTPENVQSIRNALMLGESWMARVDSGHLITNQVYAIPTIDIVQEALQASTEYDWRIGGVPVETLLECDACSLDVKLLESHARIVQAFLATGIEERLRREIQWVDGIPANRQNSSALGVENFKHILHHKLTIL